MLHQRNATVDARSKPAKNQNRYEVLSDEASFAQSGSSRSVKTSFGLAAAVMLDPHPEIPRGSLVYVLGRRSRPDQIDVEYDGRVLSLPLGHTLAGMHSTDRPIEDLLECTDEWLFSLIERRRLHDFAMGRFRETQLDRLRTLARLHAETAKGLQEIRNHIDLRVLRNSDVIASGPKF